LRFGRNEENPLKHSNLNINKTRKHIDKYNRQNNILELSELIDSIINIELIKDDFIFEPSEDADGTLNIQVNEIITEECNFE
jgi:hypothetical protein